MKWLLVMIIAAGMLQAGQKTLDELAVKYETDKSSHCHRYTAVYEPYFAPLRDKKIKFLEIGFATGSSAHMWEDFFEQADLYFIDILKDCFKKHGKDLKRSKFFQVDQSDRGQLEAFVRAVGGEFDIIVDDGGHTMTQQITSFEMLFPHVKSGGIYVVEDLHTSYWKLYGGGGTQGDPYAQEGSAIQFLLQRVHDINRAAARTGRANFSATPPRIKSQISYCSQHIQSMHFYGSMCFIFKR